MLDLHPFPVCCTMQVITGFGGTEVAGAHTRGREATVDQLVTDLEQCCHTALDRGMAIVTATTNDQQTNANSALRQAGFAHSRWAAKTQHPETTVRIWYKRLNPNGID